MLMHRQQALGLWTGQVLSLNKMMLLDLILFAFLGLRDEDEQPMQATSLNDTSVDGTNIDVAGNTNYEDVDTEGAAIPIDDHVSEEENIDYDMDNPNMEEGSKFPSMEIFRVATPSLPWSLT